MNYATMKTLCLLIIISCVLFLIPQSCTHGGTFTDSHPQKLRVIVESDLGGDPDDEASMTRFFLYMNEWDVEALIGTRGKKISRLDLSAKDMLLQYIDDYESVYSNLLIHKDGYPTPDYLRARTVQYDDGDVARDLIISVIDKPDPRSVYISNWGTLPNGPYNPATALRRALDHVKATRSADEYRSFVGKIRYSQINKYDRAGKAHLANMLFHLDVTDDMDGGRWYHRWRPITEKAGGFDVKSDIKNDHGPLAANYTIQKEGDTPTFMFWIRNGLGDFSRPDWGGWAGRYSNHNGNAWEPDQQDTWKGSTNRDNTLLRFADHIQMDFAARADWCVAATYGEVNHEPIPFLQGDGSQRIFQQEVTGWQNLTLSADGTNDPDGDALTYRWIYYQEAGTWPGEVTISNSSSPECTVQVPADAVGKKIHIYLEVTDKGIPPLTRYRRAVLTLK
jgi:hypothetical protein